MVCAVRFNMPKQKESTYDRHTALHHAGNHHLVCGRCGRAGQLAFVTGDISAYAPSHCGQDFDGNRGRKFTETCARLQLNPPNGYRDISGPPSRERIDEEFPFARP
jgi:hypothetical protein